MQFNIDPKDNTVSLTDINPLELMGLVQIVGEYRSMHSLHKMLGLLTPGVTTCEILHLTLVNKLEKLNKFLDNPEHKARAAEYQKVAEEIIKHVPCRCSNCQAARKHPIAEMPDDVVSGKQSVTLNAEVTVVDEKPSKGRKQKQPIIAIMDKKKRKKAKVEVIVIEHNVKTR